MNIFVIGPYCSGTSSAAQLVRGANYPPLSPLPLRMGRLPVRELQSTPHKCCSFVPTSASCGIATHARQAVALLSALAEGEARVGRGNAAGDTDA